MIIDNKTYSRFSIGTAAEFLKGALETGTGILDVATGFFTVSALDWLGRFAPRKFRLVLAKIAGMDDGPSRIVNLLTGACNIRSGFTLSAKAKSAIAFLKRDSVDVRSVDNAFCHAKAYLYKDASPEKSFYLMGSSNLTESGLGITSSSNLELNVAERGETDKNFADLSAWFDNLWNHVAKERIKVIGNGGYMMQKAFVENIPIPTAPPAQQAPIVALVDRILAAKAADAGADTSALEAEIDALVYRLYGLTDEEIAVVEGRK